MIYFASIVKYALDNDVEGQRPIASEIHKEGIKLVYKYAKNPSNNLKQSKKLKRFLMDCANGDFSKYPN